MAINFSKGFEIKLHKKYEEIKRWAVKLTAAKKLWSPGIIFFFKHSKTEMLKSNKYALRLLWI